MIIALLLLLVARRHRHLVAGALQDFGLSAQVPGKAGDTLTFKALQTYSNGQTVRWIGPEGSEHPAPTVAVVSARASGTSAPSATTAPPAQPSGSAADSGGSDTLAVVALVVGALGLLVAAAALIVVRRGLPAGGGRRA